MLLKKALGYHFTIKFTLHMWVDQKKKKKKITEKKKKLIVSVFARGLLPR